MSIEWKQQLLGRGYTTATVNSMLIALNRFYDFMGWNDCRVNVLKPVSYTHLDVYKRQGGESVYLR